MNEAVRTNAEQVLAIENRMEFGAQISGIQLTIRQLIVVIERLEADNERHRLAVDRLRGNPGIVGGVMSPETFAKRMQESCSIVMEESCSAEDREYAHGEADEWMAWMLSDLGYVEAARIYEKMVTTEFCYSDPDR